MKPQAYQLILAAAVALMLGACASTTATQFYTLIPTASPSSVANASASMFQISVQPVVIPDQVDRPQLVVREGNGGIVPVETRQWIAPLSSEIRGALSADLTNRLGVQDVYGIAATPGQITYIVKLKVQRFDSALGAYARIDALWTVQAGKDASAAPVCSSSASSNVAPGYSELALGHQRALAQIADDIAASIRNAHQGSVAPVCPASAAR
ncbi:MAG: PqiC family protein [Stenotrophobium sp.]